MLISLQSVSYIDEVVISAGVQVKPLFFLDQAIISAVALSPLDLISGGLYNIY